METLIFNYYQFLAYKGIIIGRPVNPLPKMIKVHRINIVNPKWLKFERAITEHTLQVVEGIPAGLYDRKDVKMTTIGDYNYYTLKEKEHASA